MVAASWATIHPKEAGPMAPHMSVLGIDLAKLVFHIVGMDDRGHGHEVRLIAPQFIKAPVKWPTNEAREAKAIGEAMNRPPMRFVPMKPPVLPRGLTIAYVEIFPHNPSTALLEMWL